jgi:hypothetical protein
MEPKCPPEIAIWINAGVLEDFMWTLSNIETFSRTNANNYSAALKQEAYQSVVCFIDGKTADLVCGPNEETYLQILEKYIWVGPNGDFPSNRGFFHLGLAISCLLIYKQSTTPFRLSRLDPYVRVLDQSANSFVIARSLVAFFEQILLIDGLDNSHSQRSLLEILIVGLWISAANKFAEEVNSRHLCNIQLHEKYLDDHGNIVIDRWRQELFDTIIQRASMSVSDLFGNLFKK